MANGYGNRNFTRSVQQNWICAGDGKESAFFVNQFAEGADVPEGATRASDNYLEAERQNVAMNTEAGFRYNAETNTFVKDGSEAGSEAGSSLAERRAEAAVRSELYAAFRRQSDALRAEYKTACDALWDGYLAQCDKHIKGGRVAR